MAIENTYLLDKNIILGCGFDLNAEAPLDSRQTVPSYAGLAALISGNAAYEGMLVYDEETKKTYQAQSCAGYKFEGNDKTYYIEFKEFGINQEELKDLIASETTAAMEFKGAAASLPENPSKGDFYKVTTEFAVGEETAKVGDSIVYDGSVWFIIPSGDDIEDTWRAITGVNNDATLTFTAGDKIDVDVAATGEIKISHEAIEAPELLAENEQTRTYITAVETDGYGHITGYKTATENVEDTNTTYEFEGQSEDSSVYFTVTSSEENADPVTIHLDAYSKNEVDEKVDNAYADAKDYTDTSLNNYYDKEEITGLIQDSESIVIEELDGKISDEITRATEVEEALEKRISDVEDAKLDANGWAPNNSADGWIHDNTGNEINSSHILYNNETEFAELDYEGLVVNNYTDEEQVHYGVSGIRVKSYDWDNDETSYNSLHFPKNKAGTFALTSDVDNALQAAKDYADAKSHENTTYEVAATANPLEFTVTPSEGEAQTVTLVAPTVDTGVMKVTAGADIVVTPEAGTGEVTVAHKSYQTGTIKAAEGTEEPNFVTSVTINNGHVEGATVQTLRAALESMTFIFDGGTSAI